MRIEDFSQLQIGQCVLSACGFRFTITERIERQHRHPLFKAISEADRSFTATLVEPNGWQRAPKETVVALDAIQVDQVIVNKNRERFLVTDRIERQHGHPILRAICLTTQRHITVTNATVWSVVSKD